MKLFITSKIYDTEKQTIEEIEKAVQEDIDHYVGKDKVIFKLYIAGKTGAMYFYRGINYSSFHDPKEMIIDADAYLITGEGYDDFNMPVSFPTIPYGNPYSMEQKEFLRAYKASYKALTGKKRVRTELDINEKRVILTVK